MTSQICSYSIAFYAPAASQVSVLSIYVQVENHFFEMKGDVGMSGHEKKGNKKMHTPRQKVIHNSATTPPFGGRPFQGPSPTSLLC